MSQPDVSRLIHSLERRDKLSDQESEAVRRGPWRVRDYAPQQEIVAQGSRPSECCLVIDGFTGRTVDFPDGRRQITALQVPGDFVDLHGLFLHVMDHNVVALTPVTAAFIPHEVVRGFTESMPHLSRMLWMLTGTDAAIQRSTIACIGRRSVDGHLAHLICEAFLRLEAVGMTSGRSFRFPFSQTQIADMLGASIVHVNRMLQQLRGTGLISWDRHNVEIRDWDRLAKFGEFDPTYLNLRAEPL